MVISFPSIKSSSEPILSDCSTGIPISDKAYPKLLNRKHLGISYFKSRTKRYCHSLVSPYPFRHKVLYITDKKSKKLFLNNMLTFVIFLRKFSI